MAGDEWIAGPAGPLKTDFEHRDIGKNKLNLYDLADTILQLRLTRDEEGDLLTRYAAATGDAPQGERLSLCKLMAGLWTRQTALDGIVKQTHIARCWIESRSLGAARPARSTQRQTSTGILECVSTFNVWLPRTSAATPLLPCEPMTMRSHFFACAVSMMDE